MIEWYYLWKNASKDSKRNKYRKGNINIGVLSQITIFVTFVPRKRYCKI